MNSKLAIGLLPVILIQAAGAAVVAGPTFAVRESSRNTLLRIQTTYNFPVDAAHSETFASATAGTSGNACGYDTPGFDSDTDPGKGETADENANASASDTLYVCNPTYGGDCDIAHASSNVALGLSQDRLTSTISVTTAVNSSKLTTSAGCDICESNGTGQVGASWVAAWALGQSGSIDSIQVTMDMNFDSLSYTQFCNVLTGGLGGGSTGGVMSDEFTSFTAEYFDSNHAGLGSETYQGVIFYDIDGNGADQFTFSGALYSDPSPSQIPCLLEDPITGQVFDDCIILERNVSFSLTIPANTAYVVYSGETLNTSEFEYMDVNRDGVIDYFDRVDIALSFGVDVDNPAYLPWADLTRNGVIDAADGAILESLNCIADLNNDGLVDLTDINIYTGWFSSQDPIESAKADLDGNGVNNFADLSIFSSLASVGCSN